MDVAFMPVQRCRLMGDAEPRADATFADAVVAD